MSGRYAPAETFSTECLDKAETVRCDGFHPGLASCREPELAQRLRSK
jgi:hypothetical protein